MTNFLTICWGIFLLCNATCGVCDDFVVQKLLTEDMSKVGKTTARDSSMLPLRVGAAFTILSYLCVILRVSWAEASCFHA